MALFGSAIVVALNQAQPLLTAAEQAFLAGGACQVQCSVFDTEGNPLAPSGLQWRMDDLRSRRNVVRYQAVPGPGAVAVVNITPVQNNMISYTAQDEERQVTFQITDSSGAQYLADTRYVLNRLLPVAPQGTGPL